MAGVRSAGEWSALVHAAVLGTGRATIAPASLLGRGEVADTDEDCVLLDAAALMSRARRAGYRPPETDVAAPEAAGPDTRPAVRQAAQERLAALLTAGERDFVAEWLRNLAGRRPPDLLLPALLTAGSQDPGLRASLRPVLGPRARWLAAFSHEWSWCTGVADLAAGALPDDLRATWETATAAGRRELLAALRATDPAAGRDLVAATWDTDSYRDRTAFAGLLIAGLSAGDEALAERALADRRAEVRRAGADLLARLPESAWSRRAAARAAAAVQVSRGAVRTTLTVTPPSDPQEMLADQIDVTPSASAETAEWLLRQAVATAPAGFWAGHAGLTPAQLLALTERSEWQGPLRAGWSVAAIRDADTGWLTALLDAPTAHRNVTEELALFGALPAQARDDWLLANPDNQLFPVALARLAPPWSDRLSDVVRTLLGSVARADPGRSPGPRALLRLAGRRLEPPVPPPVPAAEVHDKLAVSWASMDATLSQRAAMRRELAEEPPP